MTTLEPRTLAAPPLDRQRGREDDAQRLRVRLGDAPSEYLCGALENEHLGPDGLKLVLRNRFATADVVANPLAPVVLARQALPFLCWRDLAEVAANVRLSPTLRRDAEKVLRTRLAELSVGERTALARRPSRGIVEMLRDEPDPAVLRALSGNPRVAESDIVRIVARRDAPAAFLGWLSDQSPWGQRRDVMLALVQHPRAPRAVALRLVQRLSPGDLDELCRGDSVPRLVRVAVERRLAGSCADSGPVRPQVG